MRAGPFYRHQTSFNPTHPMTPLKFGIIGTGGMAKAHVEWLEPIEGVELTACLDLDAERAQAFAKQWNVRHAMTELPKLLDACDVVSIVTPDSTHAPLSLEVLASGTHLLCEKPLTTNLADAQAVAAAAAKAAAEHGTQTAVNFTYRNSPAFVRARELVLGGEIGEVRHLTGSYFQSWIPSKVWGGWPNREAWIWRMQIPKNGNDASGGVLGDVGCHILDFATGIAGDADAVRCRMRNFPKIHPDTGEFHTEYEGATFNANDSVTIDLDLNGGGMGVLQASRWAVGHANQVALGVYGTRGALEIDLDQWNDIRLCLGDDVHAAEFKTHTLEPTPTNHQRLIHSIRTGEVTQPTIERGAHIQAYLHACEQSAMDDGAATPVPAIA